MNPESNAAIIADWKATINECEAIGANKERARILGILRSPEAAGNSDRAFQLALTTDMTVAQACVALVSTPRGPIVADEQTVARQLAEVRAFLSGNTVAA